MTSCEGTKLPGLTLPQEFLFVMFELAHFFFIAENQSSSIIIIRMIFESLTLSVIIRNYEEVPTPQVLKSESHYGTRPLLLHCNQMCLEHLY